MLIDNLNNFIFNGYAQGILLYLVVLAVSWQD